jgi:PTH1 family peptidyl-tRNA hydrolase
MSWLLVGLGNPGSKYERTRHNAGAWLLDVLQEHWGFPAFHLEKTFQALVSRNDAGILNREYGEFPNSTFQIPYSILAFPQTFMNDSGSAVAQLMQFYNIPLDRLIVLHDDKETPLGEIRIQRDRSAAGHNGVRSVIDALDTQDFWRVRLGIGVSDQPIPTDAFVLAPFTESEQALLSSTVFPNTV